MRLLTDQGGAVTDRYDYDAWGNLLSRQGSTNNSHLYCGEEFDSSLGLYNLRARLMNPLTERFWTADSFPGRQSDPASLHRYSYCHHDAVNFSDPHGNAEISLPSLSAVTSFISNLGLRVVINAPRINIFVIEAISGQSIYVGGGVVLGAKAGAEVLPKVAGGLQTLLRTALRLGQSTKIGSYKGLGNALAGSGNQANHLLQNKAFEKVIPEAEGICVEVVGSINQPGSQHNIFHKAVEEFWEVFRTGARAGERPTVKEYLNALSNASERAGLDGDALDDLAQAQWEEFGGKVTDLVPEVPNPIPPQFLP